MASNVVCEVYAKQMYCVISKKCSLIHGEKLFTQHSINFVAYFFNRTKAKLFYPTVLTFTTVIDMLSPCFL